MQHIFLLFYLWVYRCLSLALLFDLILTFDDGLLIGDFYKFIIINMLSMSEFLVDNVC